MSALPAVTVLLVAVMLASAGLQGGAILRLLRLEPPPLERWLYATLLGVGAQATAFLALAAIGWLHPLLLWATVVIPAALCVRSLNVFTGALRELHTLLATADPVERIVAAVVGIAVVTVLVLGALGPVTDWDSLMYHLQIPRQILDAGRLHVPPDGMHLAFLGSFQFLYLPLLAVDAVAGPALLNAAMALVLGIAVLVAGTRLFDLSAGLFAAVALWGSSSLLLVATTARVDVTLIAAVFLAHAAVLSALRGNAPWAIPLTAVSAGVAIGMKYHALPYLAPLVPFTLWALWREEAGRALRVLRVGGRALVALAVCLLLASPWLIKNQVLFGAPLYPFFAERVTPPFIAELQGGDRRDPPAAAPEIHTAMGRAREPISIGALLFRPTALTVEGEAAAYTRNPLLFLAPLALLWLRDARLLALLLPAAAYLGVALGYFSRTNLRYLMPVIPAMLLLSGEVIRRAGTRLPSARVARRVLIIVAALVTLPALRIAGARTLTPLRVEIALGLEPPEALLNGEVQYVLAKWFAEQTPPDAKLLMLFDARGFYHERATIQDNLLTNWPLLLATGVTDRCLAGSGITHVYVNHAILAYYQARGLDPALLAWDKFPEFAARCLEPMVDVNGIALFRVR